MPIHDWTRVDAGIFHDFHNAWITFLRNAFNGGLLPKGYYALGEQFAGPICPDVLTLQTESSNGPPFKNGSPRGMSAVALAPPRVRFTAHAETQEYVVKQRNLVIRHQSGDNIVAIVEILSSGNKAGKKALEKLLDKVLSAFEQNIHVLLVDLYPPTQRDRQGIHGLIWKDLIGEKYRRPADKPLTLASYAVGLGTTAYVEPVAVGDDLIEMPLFLDPDFYVKCPLEKTYREAYLGVPERWKKVLERQP